MVAGGGERDVLIERGAGYGPGKLADIYLTRSARTIAGATAR